MPRYMLAGNTRSDLYALPDELKREFINAVGDKRSTTKRAGRHYKGDWSDAAQDLVEELISGAHIDERYPNRAVYVKEIVKTLGKQHSLSVPRHWAGNDGNAVSPDTPGAQLVRSYIKCKKKPEENDDVFNNRKGFFKQALRRVLAHGTVPVLKEFLNSEVAKGGYDFVRKHYRISASHEGDRPANLPGALEKDRAALGTLKARRREILEERRNLKARMRETQTVDQLMVDPTQQRDMFNLMSDLNMFAGADQPQVPHTTPIGEVENVQPTREVGNRPTLQDGDEGEDMTMPVVTPIHDDIPMGTAFTSDLVTNRLLPTAIVPLQTPQLETRLGPFDRKVRDRPMVRRFGSGTVGISLPIQQPTVANFNTPIVGENTSSPPIHAMPRTRERRFNPDDRPVSRYVHDSMTPPEPIMPVDEIRLAPKPIPPILHIPLPSPLRKIFSIPKPKPKTIITPPINRVLTQADKDYDASLDWNPNPKSKPKPKPKIILTKKKRPTPKPILKRKVIRNPILKKRTIRRLHSLSTHVPKAKHTPRKIRKSKKLMEPLIMGKNLKIKINPRATVVQYPQLQHPFVQEKLRQINGMTPNLEILKPMLTNMNSFLKDQNLFDLVKFQNKWGDDLRGGNRK